MPTSSVSSIPALCDALVEAYASRGVAVHENLGPGLSREQILRIVAPLNITLPEGVIALYQWRNGHIEEDADDVIRFRDNTFVSLERAVEEHAEILSSYGIDSTLEDDGVDLRASFPISAFEGSWDVVACGAHLHRSAGDHPVIRVFQGVEMYYPSVESMLRICTEWVSHPDWDPVNGLSGDAELKIWRRHVPGIFDDA